MFCKKCGKEIDDQAVVCVNCGVPVDNKKFKSSNDTPSHLVGIASCCFPIVGIVLYFLWKDEKPQSASLVCKWTIAGLVISVISFFIGILLGALGEMM